MAKKPAPKAKPKTAPKKPTAVSKKPAGGGLLSALSQMGQQGPPMGGGMPPPGM